MMQTSIESVYKNMQQRVALGRKLLGRPLTLAEKILVGHLETLKNPDGSALRIERRRSNMAFHPDRVAMQDATAQMALLQFMHAKMNRVAVPTTVHCDHLIQAHVGAKADLQQAKHDNDEVYSFLKTASARYGIGFWEPGAGIIHQVVLENYAFPGGMMIGTDSHTPNAGGLGMLAIGVGGADAVDVMAGMSFGLRWPGLIGVRLTGSMSGWTSPKDVILKLMGILTVKGGTGHIVEFFGPGTASISCTGKGTICNMGAEHGATTSVFPYDERMQAYLQATARADVAALADTYKDLLVADKEVHQNPEAFYDKVIDIDLSTLEPHIVGPHSPDVSRPISAFKEEVAQGKYPENFRFSLIGSCTNSSYEDIGLAANVATQAKKVGLAARIPFMVTPGSEQIYNTILRDGQMLSLQDIGAQVLANACGPCIGQWQRDDIKKNEVNAIVTSYNRNFKGRNDANPDTMAFIVSPAIATAFAISGETTFNPLTDTIEPPHGKPFKFSPPTAAELPPRGFVAEHAGFIDPPADGKQVVVSVDLHSKRLQILEPFSKWDGKDILAVPVLLKAKGKCTTDHISPAGVWLRFRGHLDLISDNMFSGAVNAFTTMAGKGTNVISKQRDIGYAAIARDYKAAGIGWVVFGDENYGEGSSREHAAMSPRYLGGRAIIVRSFARIHETNLKKQGVLALTFKNPLDYDKVQEFDKVSIFGLATLAPEKNLKIELLHQDGSKDHFEVLHGMTLEQIDWYRAGSALNCIAAHQPA